MTWLLLIFIIVVIIAVIIVLLLCALAVFLNREMTNADASDINSEPHDRGHDDG